MNGKRVIAGIMTATGVVILCGLGAWQVQRLEWKNNYIAHIEQAEASPRLLNIADLNAPDTPVLYGSLRGTMLSGKEVLVGPRANEKGEIGYHLVTPLQLSGGIVLIDRGWIDNQSRDPEFRRHLRSPAPVTFTGFVRKPDYNRFTSGNNPADDQWLKLDVQQIAEAKNLDPVMPVVMYAERADRKFDAMRMNAPGWRPRNNHLQYAIFWLTMAAVLAGFYGFVTWRNKKAR